MVSQFSYAIVVVTGCNLTMLLNHLYCSVSGWSEWAKGNTSAYILAFSLLPLTAVMIFAMETQFLPELTMEKSDCEIAAAAPEAAAAPIPISCASEDLSALLKRAEKLKDASEYSKAITVFDRYLSMAPEDAEALAEKAYCQNGDDNFKAALATADEALSLEPGNVDGLSNKAWALNHLNRFPEALETAQKSLSLYPDDGESLCAKGEALMGLGRYEESQVALDKHCQVHSSEWYAYDVRARLHKKMGHSELAKKDRDKADAL